MRDKNVKITIFEKLLSFSAPRPCSGCGKVGSEMCTYCKYDIENERVLGCVMCQGPSRGGVCVDHAGPFSRASIVGDRAGALKRLIDTYKFERAGTLCSVLAELLDENLPHYPAHTIVVPVPARASQVRVRGYDHVGQIAELFAARRHLTVQNPFVAHSQRAQHFADTKLQRIALAEDAFSLTGSVDSSRPYLIIDDVITTGATLSSLASLLADAGVMTRWVAAIARQPLD